MSVFVYLQIDVDVEDDDIGTTPWSNKEKQPNLTQKQTAIDITAEDLVNRLNAHNVADLVLISMVSLLLI